MMEMRAPADRRPSATTELPLGGSRVASAIGSSANESQTAIRGAGPIGACVAGRSVQREFARYVLVGGFAFVCDTCTLYSLTQFLGLNYLISAAIGFVLGVGVNYLLCRKWVFQRRRLKSTTVEMTIFVLIGIVGLGLNEIILWTFQSKLGIYYMFAKGVSGVVVFMWNFGARKLALFR